MSRFLPATFGDVDGQTRRALERSTPQQRDQIAADFARTLAAAPQPAARGIDPVQLRGQIMYNTQMRNLQDKVRQLQAAQANMALAGVNLTPADVYGTASRNNYRSYEVGGSPYKGGWNASDAGSLADDAAGTQSVSVQWTGNSRAKVNNTRIYGVLLNIFPTSATGGFFSTNPGTFVVSMTLNGVQLASIQQVPGSIVAATGTERPNISRLYGPKGEPLVIDSDDALVFTVDTITPGFGGAAQTTGFTAVLLSGGEIP